MVERWFAREQKDRVPYDSYCMYCRQEGRDTFVKIKHTTSKAQAGSENGRMYDGVCQRCMEEQEKIWQE